MRLLIMLTVFLCVDKPVASLQFDLATTADVVRIESGIDKQVSVARLSDGRLRVIVFGLNQTTFSGKFASIEDEAAAIENVVASDATGGAVAARVTTLSPPKGLTITYAR